MLLFCFVEFVLEKGLLQFSGQKFRKTTITVGITTGWKEKVYDRSS